VGAVQVVEEALRVALTVVKSWPNRLLVASCHRRPPPFEGKRNDLLVPLRCQRPKPHRNPSFGAARCLPPVSSHGALSQAGAAPPPDTLHHPILPVRPGLDWKIPFHDNEISAVDHKFNGRYHFTMLRTRGPKAVDSVHAAINPKILENS
jgi:hypothetical protein